MLPDTIPSQTSRENGDAGYGLVDATDGEIV